MKISEHENDLITATNKLILDKMGMEAYQGIFNTMLGCGNNICKYIINEKDLLSLPTAVKYSMLQIHSMMVGLSAAIHGETDVLQAAYLPVDEESWNSEEDFEKRLILLVKMFHKALKAEGKL